jgi:hypothetical protein
VIPKPENNAPNEHKMCQLVIKISQISTWLYNISQSKALQNLPKMGFLV